jgi:hypothetical protein
MAQRLEAYNRKDTANSNAAGIERIMISGVTS